MIIRRKFFQNAKSFPFLFEIETNWRLFIFQKFHLYFVFFLTADVPIEVVENFEALKHKIDYLEKQIEQKENDLNNLKESFSYNVKYYNDLVDKQKYLLADMGNSKLETMLKSHLAKIATSANPNNATLIEKSPVNQHLKDILIMQILSQNLNFSQTDIDNANKKSNLDVEFKHIAEFLPHLNKQQNVLDLIQPKFKLSKNRNAPFVIGVPTIKREKTSYLLETLKSLFDAMNDLEKTDVLVVVLIAEIEDQAFVQSTIESISKGFRFEVDSGLLEIIVPPIEYYPDLNSFGMDRVFNDSAERVKWRTKQNLDFSYLMTYAWKRGKYYLQLEDDIVTKAGFMNSMKVFVEKQSNNSEWLIIEFSQLGFIGKLFRAHDLPIFVNFFLMFARDKPCDWLLESVLDVRICNPEKGDHHCARSKENLKIKYKPSLFQHVGLQSSLKGKTQKLKDKEFGKQVMLVKHNNPPARCSTSLKTYMKYSIEGAYLGQNVFWAMAPKANDFILFQFEQPSNVYK